MDRMEVEEIAEIAARRAVSEMMVALGIDTHDAQSLLRTQRNFAQLHDWVMACDEIKRHSLKTMAGIVVVGGLGALWLIIKNQLHRLW